MNQERYESLESQGNLSPLEASFFKNFFWSFHHSQGDPTLQTSIMVYLARQYRPEDLGLVEELNGKLEPLVERLNIPQGHSDKFFNTRSGKYDLALDKKAALESQGGFRMSWKRYIKTFDEVFHGSPNPHDKFSHGNQDNVGSHKSQLTDRHLLAQVLWGIVLRDSNYQVMERPNRINGDDPHESFLRSYVFEDKNTQSPEYAKLYQELHSLLKRLGFSEIVDGDPSLHKLLERGTKLGLNNADIIRGISDLGSNLRTLIQRWEQVHPQQKFLPQERKSITRFFRRSRHELLTRE